MGSGLRVSLQRGQDPGLGKGSSVFHRTPVPEPVGQKRHKAGIRYFLAVPGTQP